MLAIISETIIIAGLCFLIVWIGLLALIIKCYIKANQGQVIIRNGFGGSQICFSGIFVIPLIQNAEFLDITLKRIVIERLENEALTCKDGICAEIKAAFFIRINPTVENVLQVVSKLGVTRAADTAVLKEIYEEQFIHALTTVTSEYDYETLSNRELFKEKVMDCVGKELDGFMLDVVTIDYLEKSKQ